MTEKPDLAGMHSPVNPAAVVSASQDAIIEASWERSRKAGLTPDLAPDFSGTNNTNIKSLLDQNHQLAHLAYPVLEALHEQIANTHSMVLLTDGQGRILHSLGDDSFLERADKVALKPGVDWSEVAKGTNAIGTAITLGRPVVVHGQQHFLEVNRFLTCSSTPIFNPDGKVIGVLDVSGDARNYYHHTIALSRMSAQIIENQVFSETYQDTVRLHFHSRPEFIGTLFEGMVSFSPGGRFLAANRGALFQLGLEPSVLQRHSVSSLFGISMDELMDHCRSSSPQLLTLSLHNGVAVKSRVDMRVMKLWQVPADASGTAIAPPVESQWSNNLAAQRREQMSSLRYLDTGDPQVGAVVQKLRRIQGHEIPIMIFGETGVGKELLAKAIHNDSPRARNPFIAVNCASIPESLIESELFGYEEGAFTGARRKGAMGKIQMANGGTLFLDEIGDMPLSLQTRLLRALQEKVITPLGSNRSIPVNFAVISATHRNLRQMVSEGQFREDLYYRLNGLAVRVPALRERTDLETIINHILQTGTDIPGGKKLSPEVLQMFARYCWPGNVRQLTNVLRTASVLAGNEPSILIEHLPDDFLEEVRARQANLDDPCQATKPTPLDFAQSGAFAVTGAAGAAMPTAGAGAAAGSAPAWAGKGLQEVEIEAITQALARCNGNVSQAARLLGVSRNTIYRKVPELAQK
ncbi:MAG: hypothetical protein RLZZ271_612 [Pseudomonadota bacterium]|jgi:transcriptional regulator of acetoin/glycerol metabolism